MRRFRVAMMCLFFVTCLMATTVWAQSPHFVTASASVNNSCQLTVSFKEAGLGANVLIDYEADAAATATYGCINNGDKHPKASNKQTVSGPVSGAGSFSSGKNGSITASITVNPPAQPAGFSCPPGQPTIAVISCSYTSVSITDTSNAITDDIAGTFGVVLFH